MSENASVPVMSRHQPAQTFLSTAGLCTARPSGRFDFEFDGVALAK